MTVAEQYPARHQDGALWYKPEPRRLQGKDGFASDGGQGWTNDPGYADRSYGVGDGQGTPYPPPADFAVREAEHPFRYSGGDVWHP